LAVRLFDDAQSEYRGTSELPCRERGIDRRVSNQHPGPGREGPNRTAF